MSDGVVHVVGAGPGDPDLLTVRAAQLLARADLLVYDPYVSSAILALAPEACERVGTDMLPHAEIEALLARRAHEGATVVHLHRGDADVAAMRIPGVRADIVPGVTPRPLRGKRVLITRPAKNAQAFATTLQARGIEPIFASTIAIFPPDDHHAAHAAIDDLAAYGWVVFTSQNGVDAFFDRLRSLNADARYIGRTRVAAIGSKTAERLEEWGVRADLMPSEFVGEEIARALIEATHDGERILIFRAQEGRDVLPQMLEEAGRAPHVVAAYKTLFDIDPHFADKVAQADILTFTSASSVRGFIELLGGDARAAEAARGKLVACIGPITADVAGAAGLRVAVIADVSTTDGLLDALEAHLSLYP
jgi:uroporphyrinogen-III synthase